MECTLARASIHNFLSIDIDTWHKKTHPQYYYYYSFQKRIDDLHQSQVHAYREAAVKALREWVQVEAPLEPMEENDTQDTFVERCVAALVTGKQSKGNGTGGTHHPNPIVPNWRLDSAKMVLSMEVRKRARAVFAKYHPPAEEEPAETATANAAPPVEGDVGAESNDNDDGDDNNSNENEEDDGEMEEDDGEIDEDEEDGDGEITESTPGQTTTATDSTSAGANKTPADTSGGFKKRTTGGNNKRTNNNNKKKGMVRKKGTVAKQQQQQSSNNQARKAGAANRGGRRGGRAGGNAKG